MFQGFSQNAVDFLWGVKFNNNREWFLAHKQVYLNELDQPLRELAAQLLHERSLSRRAAAKPRLPHLP